MKGNVRSPWVRYGFAVLCGAGALALRFALDPVLGDRQPFPTFYLAVVLSAWFGGVAPGLLTVVLGYFAADWFFVPPRHTVTLLHPQVDTLAGGGLYVVIASVLVCIAASMRRTQEGAAHSLAAAERAREEAETRIRDIEALMRANRELSRSMSLDALLPLLSRLARSLVKADGAAFVLNEGESVHYAAEDAVAPLWAGRRFSKDMCISGWAIRERRTAAIADIYSDSRIPVDVYRSTFVKSLVMVPVRRDEPLGAMGVYWAEKHVASEREVRLVEALADAAAIAMANTRLFAELEAARMRAETENRAKDEFLAMLGHELRNPLAAVRNAVTTASLDDSLRERALSIARRQSDQLGRLIDDLLDVARITQGRIVLRKEIVYLHDVVLAAIETSRAFIEAREHQLRVVDSSGGVRVEADPARLEQVIVNLLNNAAKYTEPGGTIEVVVEHGGDEAVLRVRDTGIGMTHEMLARVFDLFTQADRSLDRVNGGLGIGLTIARRLVLLHGGSIEAFSEGIGKGCELIVRVPAQPGSSRPVAARVQALDAGACAPAAARILLVEDNPDSAESLRMLLELLGHRVRVVNDGLAALEAAHAGAPDVMLIDIGLPGMDGYEVARRLRRSSMDGLVLVALTGYGRDEDKERSLAAGFDYHLVKPVNLADLESLLGELRKSAARREPLTVH